MIQELTYKTRGASMNTLRTSTLALVYSVAEYCSPVLLNSSHTNINVQMNSPMRLISNTNKSTPTQWLPVLSNISPSQLRHAHYCTHGPLVNKNFPTHQKIAKSRPAKRLKSRNPAWRTAVELANHNFQVTECCKTDRNKANPDKYIISDPSDNTSGQNPPRKKWTTLNRLRTGHGRCNNKMH